MLSIFLQAFSKKELVVYLSLFFIVFGLVIKCSYDGIAEEAKEKDFVTRCREACFPNSVYSTKYYRCECDVNIVVKPIQ